MILLVGGTGLLGRELAGRLLAGGEHLRVMTRRPEAARGLAERGVEVVPGDLRDPASTQAAVHGCAAVVAAAHGFDGPRGTSPASVDRDGNRTLVEAAAAQHADVVLMSVVGASPDSPLELFRMKAVAERHLRERRAGTVVRPTAYAELWIRLARETAGRGGRPVVLGRGRTLVNVVSVRDVAALVERVLHEPATRGETLELGGPDNLTMTELATMVQTADGRPGRPRHVPPQALRLAAATPAWVSPALRRRARMALWVDAEDHPFDADGARARFPDLPRTTVAELLQRVAA